MYEPKLRDTVLFRSPDPTHNSGQYVGMDVHHIFFQSYLEEGRRGFNQNFSQVSVGHRDRSSQESWVIRQSTMIRTTPLLRRWCVEVERKFRYEPVFVNRLKANSGSPAFVSLEYLGQTTFTDTYFDDPVSTLSTQGVWVRQRGTDWQAKIRQGGDYTNSQFQELSCPDDIDRMLKSYNIQYLPSLARGSDKTFGLKSMAQFTTIREAWRADKKFKIVLDKTDFGHAVGEVELELELELELESNKNDNYDESEKLWAAERQGMITQMDRQIETFMQDYSWAFPDGKVVGKLSAYFEFEKKKRGAWFSFPGWHGVIGGGITRPNLRGFWA